MSNELQNTLGDVTKQFAIKDIVSTATGIIDPGEETCIVSAVGGTGIAVVLPPAAECRGRTISIERTLANDGQVATVTDPEGLTTSALAGINGHVVVRSDGRRWYVLAFAA